MSTSGREQESDDGEELGDGDGEMIRSIIHTHDYCNIAAKGWIEKYTKYTSTQYTK